MAAPASATGLPGGGPATSAAADPSVEIKIRVLAAPLATSLKAAQPPSTTAMAAEVLFTATLDSLRDLPRLQSLHLDFPALGDASNLAALLAEAQVAGTCVSAPPVLAERLGALTHLTSVHLALGAAALTRHSGLLEALVKLPKLQSLALQHADVACASALSLGRALERMPPLQVRTPCDI